MSTFLRTTLFLARKKNQNFLLPCPAWGKSHFQGTPQGLAPFLFENTTGILIKGEAPPRKTFLTKLRSVKIKKVPILNAMILLRIFSLFPIALCIREA